MVIKVSEQIELSPLKATDAPAILEQVNASRALLNRYLYWVEGVTCLASAQKYITERIHSGLPGARWFKILFNNQISGVFAVKSVSPDTGIAELGYWLTTTAHGHGIISQIIAKLPEILADSEAETVEFRCLEQNTASIKIALRSGAKLVDSIPDFMLTNKVSQKLNIYQVPLSR